MTVNNPTKDEMIVYLTLAGWKIEDDGPFKGCWVNPRSNLHYSPIFSAYTVQMRETDAN
jgi:hypothetical protein